MSKLKEIKSWIGIALAGCMLIGSASYLGWDLYKIISFKIRRPEIIQQTYQTDSSSNRVSVKIAVKQDPFWKYPERITYQGDKEISYTKLENGKWQMEEGVWTTGPDHINELRFKITKSERVLEKQLPGNPENALEILIDLDAGEEYAQANFENKGDYKETEKEAERWASNMKPLLLQNYNHLLQKKKK